MYTYIYTHAHAYTHTHTHTYTHTKQKRSVELGIEQLSKEEGFAYSILHVGGMSKDSKAQDVSIVRHETWLIHTWYASSMCDVTHSYTWNTSVLHVGGMSKDSKAEDVSIVQGGEDS